MTSFVTPKKNTEFICYVSLVSQADTDIMQVDPTLAAGDVKSSQDGGALTNLTDLPAVTPASSKMVKIILSAGEMDADNVAVVFSDAAGDEWQDLVLNIQTTAQQIDDLSTLAQSDILDDATPFSGANIDASISSRSTVTEAQVNAQCDSALADYDGPTEAEMNTAHALLATPAQVNAQCDVALSDYDGPTKAELDAGLAALTDATPAEIWRYVTRTLTQSAARIAAAVDGSDITITRGDTLSASLTGLGSLAGYVSIDFTVKIDKDDDDSEAIIRIRKNASGTGDGLLVLNGTVAGTAANGSITIDDEDDGNITIALDFAETVVLVDRSKMYYDVQEITTSVVTTKAIGSCDVSPDVTRAIV